MSGTVGGVLPKGGTSVLRTLTLAAVVAALVVVVAGSRASAAEKELQVNALANASRCWVNDEGSEVCEQIGLEVLTPAKGLATGACLTIVTYVDGAEAGTEEGCIEAAGLFWMDQDQLSAAGLPQVAVDLYGYACEGKVCDYVLTRTVALSADWVASAPKERINEQLTDHQPDCDVLIKAKGFARAATATIVLDSAALSGTGNLQWIETTGRCA